MTTLQKRLIYSAILVSVCLYTIFFSPKWLFFIVVSTFGLIGYNEFLDLAEKKGVQVNRVLVLGLAALIPVAACFSAEVMAIALITVAIFAYYFKKDRIHNAFSHTTVILFGMMYVVLFFSQLIKLRGLENGACWVFYTILIVKSGDAGAYFVGRKIGKTKLIEHISPNKSVEGAVAGFLTTVVFSLISKIYLPEASFFFLFSVGAFLGVVMQLGDLVESLMKRDAGIKDSGQIPGLGGVLDVLDSLLLTIPFVYYSVSIFLRG